MNDALEDFNDTLPEKSESNIKDQTEETPIVINSASEPKKHPKTAQHAFLIDVLAEAINIQETTENALTNAQKIRIEINQSFEEVEKSICEMNLQVEESIQKAGDKAAAALSTKMDLMIAQITAYLTEEAKNLRQINIEETKRVIELQKEKAIKETAATINKINGGNLIKPAMVFAVVFSVILSIGISYLTVQAIKENFTTPTPQSPSSPKHR
jgi:hypothetical protein